MKRYQVLQKQIFVTILGFAVIFAFSVLQERQHKKQFALAKQAVASAKTKREYDRAWDLAVNCSDNRGFCAAGTIISQRMAIFNVVANDAGFYTH